MYHFMIELVSRIVCGQLVVPQVVISAKNVSRSEITFGRMYNSTVVFFMYSQKVSRSVKTSGGERELRFCLVARVKANGNTENTFAS